jgi:hypothetical protein
VEKVNEDGNKLATKDMKTKLLTFLLALTFLFLFSCSERKLESRAELLVEIVESKKELQELEDTLKIVEGVPFGPVLKWWFRGEVEEAQDCLKELQTAFFLSSMKKPGKKAS